MKALWCMFQKICEILCQKNILQKLAFYGRINIKIYATPYCGLNKYGVAYQINYICNTYFFFNPLYTNTPITTTASPNSTYPIS